MMEYREKPLKNRAIHSAILSFALLGVSTAFGANVTLGTANDGNCYPFNCNDSGSASGQSIQYQQVFRGDQFGSSPISITAITFSDTFLTQFGFSNVPLLSGSYTFSFAYSSAAVNGLSGTLANNITSGLATFATTNSAGIAAGFTTLTFNGSAFTYNPTLGNLLLNIVVTNQANVNSASYSPANGLDADDSGAVTSRAYQIGRAAGVADSTGLVTSFTFTTITAQAPEPATYALIGSCLAALLGWKKRKTLLKGRAPVCTAVLAAVAAVSGSAQSLQITPRTIAIPKHTLVGGPTTAIQPLATLVTVPFFSRTYTIDSLQYPQTFVGTDPASTNTTTTVIAPVVPVIIVIDNGNGTFTTFDSTRKLNTSPAGSALSATLGTLTSPLFQNANYVTGGTTVGTGVQFGDAIQRATFWDSISTTSPNWHVRIMPQLKPAVTINVPASAGSVSGPFALVDLNFIGTALDNIAANYGGATTFPIFLLYETLMTQNNGTSCCILGYHTAVQTGANIQTYAMGTYLDPFQIGGGASDVSVLSHEVAEWLNDPFVNNIVPDWPAPFSFIPPGPPYTAGSCQNNLETGDPIEDRVDPLKVNFKITTFGRQYTLQNEALAPWFLHSAPSFSVNGYYTYLGPIDSEFASFAPTCLPAAPSVQ